MIIGGFTKLSTVDWPGKISTVIFCRGCNWKCPYCHNKKLIFPELYEKPVPEDKVFSYLKQRSEYLDGVVVTGGEATIQNNLQDFLEKIKKLKLAVKLDSNASKPEVLENLINNNAVDALAVDIKAPPEKYREKLGIFIDPEQLWESFFLAAGSGLPVWFRTTVVPKIHTEEDIEEIKIIAAALKKENPDKVKHVFQEYRSN